MKIIKMNLILLMLTAMVFAQSAEEAVTLLEDQQGFGVRAAALGNAYTGVADDYSAIYWNPAGLAQIYSSELSSALYHYRSNSDADYLSETTSGERTFTKLHNFGLVYPFPVSRGSLVMAFGYQKVKSLDNFLQFSAYLPEGSSNDLGLYVENDDFGEFGLLEFDRDFRQTKTNIQEGSLNQWSFGMAMDLSPRFSAGFSINLLTGGSDYRAKYEQDDINDKNIYDFVDDNGNLTETVQLRHYEDNQTLNSSYSGLQAIIGGMYKVDNRLRFGGTITLPMTIRVDEVWSNDYSYTYDIYSYADEALYQYQYEEILGSGEFDYNIKVPFKFNTGVSFQNSFLLLTGAAEFTDWSQLRYEMPAERNSADYTDLLEQNELFSEEFQEVLSWGVGAEINLFKDAVSLRGGYRYVPSAFKNADKKYDKVYYTAGLGLRLDENTFFDIAYVLGSYKREAGYYYDWDEFGDIDPMQTSEDYKTQKILAGIKLAF